MSSQDQPHLVPFFPTYETSSFNYVNISYHPSQAGECDQDQDYHQPQEVDEYCSPGSGSSDNTSRNQSVKWISSKMRFMRKMMNSEQQQHQQPARESNSSSNSNYSNGIVRVCSDCNTTKTPLWRSGPQGPKSLCNACGIRQRKARKAMAAAAINGGGQIAVDRNTPEKLSKEINASDSTRCNVIPYKKRCKFVTAQAEEKKINGSEDFSISSNQSSSSAFRPQDEKEAAILLMALSCGLIYG